MLIIYRSIDKEDIWEDKIVVDMKDAIIGVCLTAQDSVELRLVHFWYLYCISSIQVCKFLSRFLNHLERTTALVKIACNTKLFVEIKELF